MAKKRCPRGHLYDDNLPECPVCRERPFLGNAYKEKEQGKTEKEIIEERKGRGGTIEEGKEVMKEKAVPLHQRAEHTQVVRKEEKQQIEEKYRRKLVGWLVTYSLDKYGKSYELYEGRNQVGREEGNDIVINEPIISQPHALILYRDGKFYIKDLASANGTQVNDKDLEPDVSVELNDGDKIRFAKVIEFYIRTCIPPKIKSEL